MGRLMKRAEKFAKSPKAKRLEKQLADKAKDPKARAKISKRLKKLTKKNS
jgi:putative component of toxin-antitoxin plasmid stabilization module